MTNLCFFFQNSFQKISITVIGGIVIKIITTKFSNKNLIFIILINIIITVHSSQSEICHYLRII